MGLSDEEITRLVSDTVQEACSDSTLMRSSGVVSALTELAVENVRASGEKKPDRIREEIRRSIMKIDHEAIHIKEQEAKLFGDTKGLRRTSSRLRHSPSGIVIPGRAVNASLARLWCSIWPFCSSE